MTDHEADNEALARADAAIENADAAIAEGDADRARRAEMVRRAQIGRNDRIRA